MQTSKFVTIGLICLLSLTLLTGYFADPVKITSGELREWINWLSSDAMRGRSNGSPEMKAVAEWLAKKYNEFGLKPLLQDGSYFQNYSYTSRQKKTDERNVIGMIEGNDPELKDQFIILTAHFDHLGVRKMSDIDSIYNGADDNAAGTATILGIAKIIRDSGLKPGRTIIFAAFSGEESGARGSRYFAANSPVPLKNCYANLNFEMTGHSEYLGAKRYYMTGCKVSNLDDMIAVYNQNSDWKLVDTIALAERLFYQSDNIAFSRVSTVEKVSQGIPSGTFATTTMADYIHSPRDEAKLFDFENMAGLVNYFSGLVIWLSENRTEIQFTDPAFARLK
jgi:leucyl aminopeptidase